MVQQLLLGCFCDQGSSGKFGNDLAKLAIKMVEIELRNDAVRQNCKNLATQLLSAAGAVKQIVDSLSKSQSKNCEADYLVYF